MFKNLSSQIMIQNYSGVILRGLFSSGLKAVGVETAPLSLMGFSIIFSLGRLLASKISIPAGQSWYGLVRACRFLVLVAV